MFLLHSVLTLHSARRAATIPESLSGRRGASDVQSALGAARDLRLCQHRSSLCLCTCRCRPHLPLCLAGTFPLLLLASFATVLNPFALPARVCAGGPPLAAELLLRTYAVRGWRSPALPRRGQADAPRGGTFALQFIHQWVVFHRCPSSTSTLTWWRYLSRTSVSSLPNS